MVLRGLRPRGPEENLLVSRSGGLHFIISYVIILDLMASVGTCLRQHIRVTGSVGQSPREVGDIFLFQRLIS